MIVEKYVRGRLVIHHSDSVVIRPPNLIIVFWLFQKKQFNKNKKFPLGRVSHRVAMSGCLSVCLSVCLFAPSDAVFFRPIKGPEIT